MIYEDTELDKRTLIQKRLKSLPGRHLARIVLSFDTGLATTFFYTFAAFFHFGGELVHPSKDIVRHGSTLLFSPLW
jgi:hypothetical protein